VLLPLAAFASIPREQGCDPLPLVIRELMPSHIETPVSRIVFLCATDECIGIMVYPLIYSTALGV